MKKHMPRLPVFDIKNAPDTGVQPTRYARRNRDVVS